jgi:hypothetical protein
MTLFIRGAAVAVALFMLLAAASCSGTTAGLTPDSQLVADNGAGKETASAHCKKEPKHQPKKCKPAKEKHCHGYGHGKPRNWKPKCRCKCGGNGGGTRNQPPVASVAVATVNGSDFSFSPQGSYDPDGTIVKYEWDWESDGVYDFSSADGLTSHFFEGGTYIVTLRVTDNKGATATATFELTANFPPTASIAIATADGTNFQFNGTDSSDVEGGIFKWEWDFDGDGIFEETYFTDPGNISHSFSGGDHQVSLRVTDGLDATDTETITVTGNNPPNAMIQLVSEADYSGERDFNLSFAGSSDVEGPIFDAYVSIDGGDPELVDVNALYTVQAFEGDSATHSLVLTVRDGLWATGTAMASYSFEDGLHIAIP